MALRFIQKLQVDREVDFNYCETNEQLANLLIKALDETKFTYFRDKVMYCPPEILQWKIQRKSKKRNRTWRFLIPPPRMRWISKDRNLNISIDITNHQTSPTATQGSERRSYFSSPIERPERPDRQTSWYWKQTKHSEILIYQLTKGTSRAAVGAESRKRPPGPPFLRLSIIFSRGVLAVMSSWRC